VLLLAAELGEVTRYGISMDNTTQSIWLVSWLESSMASSGLSSVFVKSDSAQSVLPPVQLIRK